MSTHNICFRREIRKISCGYPLLSVAMPTDPQQTGCTARQQRLRADCASAKADQSLSWAHNAVLQEI